MAGAGNSQKFLEDMEYLGVAVAKSSRSVITEEM
jgi:hypothetical protein